MKNKEIEYAFEDFMSGEYFELEEVTVATNTFETMAERNYGYGNPDRTINADFLAAWPDLSLDAIISMNMPRGGMGKYNTGLNVGEPLLIVDGARFFPTPEESVFTYLKTLLASEVESIKIYTFSAGIFGMQGIAGAILVETKKGSRSTDQNQIFDASQFQKFKIKGFSAQPEFPKTKNHEGILKQRAAIYWNPKLVWDKDHTSIPIEFEMSNRTKRIIVKIEGVSKDRDPISKIIEIDVVQQQSQD